MSHQPNHAYEFGLYHLDVSERQLQREGQTIPLQPKAFELLLVLVRQHGHLLGKDELLHAVWPETIVEEVNLANNISYLRKVLGDSPTAHQYIETVPKRGYRFVAEVKEIGVKEQKQQAHDPQENDKKPFSSGETQPLPRLERRPQLGKGFALFALFAAVATGAYWLRGSNPPSEPFRNMQMSRLTNNGTAFEAAISPNGHVLAYIAGKHYLGGSHSLWLKDLTTQQETQLVAEAGFRYRGLAFSPDGNFIYYSLRRGGETSNTLYRVSVVGGEPQRMLAGVDSVVSFSPDGAHITFVREDESTGESSVMISNADGTAARTLAVSKFPDNFSVDGPAWSPDNKLIAIAKMIPAPIFHFRLLTLRVADGQEQPIGETKWAWLMRVAWLGDGSRLAVVGRTKADRTNDQIWQVTYPTGTLQRITNDLNSYRNLNLTPDGMTLVTVQSEVRSNLWVMEAANPRQAVPITKDVLNQNGYKGLDWTPNGNIVYTSAANGEWNLWMTNADGTQARQVTNDPDNTEQTPAVSKDGKYVIFASSRSGPGRIWRINMDGSSLAELTKGKHDLQPSFAPDGEWVVYSSERNNKRVVLKMSLQGGIPEEIPLSAEWADFPVVSPDGKLIACVYQQGLPSVRKVALLPFSGGAPVQLLNLPNTYPQASIRWQPDGRALSYLDPQDYSENIWLFPLNGSAPRKLTDFHGEQIFAYAWSRDGRSLACARGIINREVVLISQAS
jgi:Tol biopolymer transport system component/DNA-binding winged helix-turn-helix (wHTH) protein